MDLAKSIYYFEISKEDIVAKRNKEVLKQITHIFNDNKGRYGVRRVHHELINRGYNINHKRVQRLMHNAGLHGMHPKTKYHSYKGNVGRIADNVINRNFNTIAPLQKVCVINVNKMMRMKLYFYTGLVINVILFLYSLWINNYLLTLICFLMGLLLKVFNEKIPLPKYFQSIKDQHNHH